MTKVDHNQFRAVCKCVRLLIKVASWYMYLTKIYFGCQSRKWQEWLGILGTIPNRFTGFHQYSSLFTPSHTIEGIAWLIAKSTPDPRVAGSIPSLDRAIFFHLPSASCGTYKYFILKITVALFLLSFLLNFAKMNCWSKPLIPEKTSAWIAVRYKGRWLYVGPRLKTICYLWFIIINISTVVKLGISSRKYIV